MTYFRGAGATSKCVLRSRLCLAANRGHHGQTELIPDAARKQLGLVEAALSFSSGMDGYRHEDVAADRSQPSSGLDHHAPACLARELLTRDE